MIWFTLKKIVTLLLISPYPIRLIPRALLVELRPPSQATTYLLFTLIVWPVLRSLIVEMHPSSSCSTRMTSVLNCNSAPISLHFAESRGSNLCCEKKMRIAGDRQLTPALTSWMNEWIFFPARDSNAKTPAVKAYCLSLTMRLAGTFTFQIPQGSSPSSPRSGRFR